MTVRIFDAAARAISRYMNNDVELARLISSKANTMTWPYGDSKATPAVQQDNSIKFVHIMSPPGFGGLTFAYRKAVGAPPQNRMYEVAVSVCHNADQYSKKVGVATSKARLLDGEFIVIPAVNGIVPTLYAMGQAMGYYDVRE